jgi:hypothetical protein
MIYISPLQLKYRPETTILVAPDMSVKTAGGQKVFEKNIASRQTSAGIYLANFVDDRI